MHYDDEARRFNFISGLACGVVLGSGLALVVSPRAPRIGSARVRKALKRSRRRYAPQLDRLREELAKVKTSAERAAERVGEDRSGRNRRSAKRRAAVEA